MLFPLTHNEQQSLDQLPESRSKCCQDGNTDANDIYLDKRMVRNYELSGVVQWGTWLLSCGAKYDRTHITWTSLVLSQESP